MLKICFLFLINCWVYHIQARDISPAKRVEKSIFYTFSQGCKNENGGIPPKEGKNLILAYGTYSDTSSIGWIPKCCNSKFTKNVHRVVMDNFDNLNILRVQTFFHQTSQVYHVYCNFILAWS